MNLEISEKSDTAIFLVNNAGIFALYSMLKEIKLPSSKRFILIYPGFWLDFSHHYYNALNWGQTPLGLPPDAQSIFHHLFPNHESSTYLSWHQIKKLRETLVHLIRQHPLVLYFNGEPDFSIGSNNTHIINIKGPQPTQLILKKKPSLYSWVKVPKKNDINEHISTSIVKLYEIQPDQVPPNVCILGSGLSVWWALRDFKRNITSFYRPGDELTSIPVTETIDVSRLSRLSLDSTRVVSANASSNMVNVRNSNGSGFTCPLYNAIGFEFYNYPGETNYSSAWDKTKDCIWVAPKNLPQGSLTFSYALLGAQMGASDRWFNTPSYYCENYFTSQFKEKILQFGITLTDLFFQNLRGYITEHNDALSWKDTLHLYERAFNTSGIEPEGYNTFSRVIRQNRSVTITNPIDNKRIKFPAELTKDIIFLRNFFETNLAHLISRSSHLLPAVSKMATIVNNQMDRHVDTLIALIKGNPSFQATIYSDEKFASFHPPVNYCVPAEVLHAEFSKKLNKGTLFEQVHLICMFAFRVYPYLKNDLIANSFLNYINLFNSNSSLRNEKIRVKSDTDLSPQKTYFGLINSSHIPEVRPHMYSQGFFHTEDSKYNQTLNELYIGFVTGPSGHSSRILALAKAFHFNETELVELGLALFSYLAGGGNHNFHEVFSSGEFLGISYDPGTYKVLPQTITNSTEYQQLENQFKLILSDVLHKHPEYQKALLNQVAPFFQINQPSFLIKQEYIKKTRKHEKSVPHNDKIYQSLLINYSKNFGLAFFDEFISTSFKNKRASNQLAHLSSIIFDTLFYYFSNDVKSVYIYLFTQILAQLNLISPKKIQLIMITVSTILTIFNSDDLDTAIALVAINMAASLLGSTSGNSAGRYTANLFFPGSKNTNPAENEPKSTFSEVHKDFGQRPQ